MNKWLSSILGQKKFCLRRKICVWKTSRIGRMTIKRMRIKRMRITRMIWKKRKTLRKYRKEMMKPKETY